MTLAPGTKLGPYEIVAPLGAGGMGEVFRARDPRLGRDVAIKVLPAEFAQDPERLARFEREARLLAALDHPNIARIFGLEDLGAVRGLVLELAEGEDLSARIARGALPADEAVAIALQVARALEHAHERGVVHRDLKPANVKLGRDGAVKVLDFGLARAFAGEAAAADPNVSQSPTITRGMTSAGLILGTAAYMSPEQARGRTVDRRADVWSFGVVLYEMLTGVRPFGGETVSETLAAVIKDPVDFTAVPASAPPAVRRLLERCLTRDPAERLRDVGEARIVLSAPGADGAAAPANAPRPRRGSVPVLAVALAIAATAAVLTLWRATPAAGPVRRFRVPVRDLKTSFFTPLALTRDGRVLAYQAEGGVWIRRADRGEAVRVPGSAGGRTPFWSWDQSTLCFAANKRLWAYTPGGEAPRALCDIPESGEIVGGAWSADGRIVFAVWRGPLCALPAAGGAVQVLVPLDSTRIDFHGPTILPDGRTILLVEHRKAGGSGVVTVSGSPPRLSEVLYESEADEVSYSPGGHLLLTQTGKAQVSSVWAVPFSAARRRVTGPAFRVLDGAGFAACGTDGMLVAAEDVPAPLGQLVWRRRDGARGDAIGEPLQGVSGPALSPDGGRLAYSAEDATGTNDIWVQDLRRGTRARLTSGTADAESPVWSPDGSRIYYVVPVNVGRVPIVAMASDGSGVADTVANGYEPTVSPDGRRLVYVVDRRGNGDLWTVETEGPRTPRPFLATDADEEQPALSPDGRWLAYASDESGRLEVYLRRFPEGDARAQVSVNGGHWPRWSRRGDGIYFVNGDTLSFVPVSTGVRPSLGLPRRLFSTTAGEFGLSGARRTGVPVDVTADGARFVGVEPVHSAATRSLVFVENWFEEFRRR